MVNKNKPKRYIFLDLIRIVAMVFVFLHHLRFHFIESGLYPINNLWPEWLFGDLGVSLFIFLSGIGLTISSIQKGLDLKSFYSRRFLRIYPLYWISFSITLMFFYIKNGGYLSLDKFLFSLTGFNAYLESFYRTNSYIFVDWFIGLIVILYIIYPFLFYAYKKNKYIFMLLTLIVSSFSLIIFPSNMYMRFVQNRLFEFSLGILFAEIVLLDNIKIYITLLIMGLSILYVFNLFRFNAGFIIIIQFCMYDIAFLSFFYIATSFLIKNHNFFGTIILSLSSVSYAFFLIHHTLIIRFVTDFFPILRLTNKSPISLLILTVSTFLIVVLMSHLLNIFGKNIIKKLL